MISPLSWVQQAVKPKAGERPAEGARGRRSCWPSDDRPEPTSWRCCWQSSPCGGGALGAHCDKFATVNKPEWLLCSKSDIDILQ